jgi:decaprenylphospho-beta-D-ribofuranose 2-oxidase
MTVTIANALEPLSGWGRTAPTTALVARPLDVSSVRDAVQAHSGGVIPRGLGRSYGDAAQCTGGLTIDTAGLRHVGALDEGSGTIEVGSGVSLHDLMRRLIPMGWFIPVTPGTRYVTVGGAIAADVHGKNHHCDGSFARHVLEMSIVTPRGTFTVSPDREPDLFWATAGGMGLTGVVVSAVLRLIPMETSWMLVDSQRFSRLDALMTAMESTDIWYRYSVAWVDCTQGRNGNHHSVLTRGDHAPPEALPGRLRSRRREVPDDPTLRVPRTRHGGLLNRLSIRALNEAWFRFSRESEGSLQSLSGYFHPLDGIGAWNLLYGPRGFVQYQFAVPSDRGDVVQDAVEAVVSSGVPSFLAVLKRFGPGTPGPFSFAQEGWTLALDFPLGPSTLPALLDRLDDAVAGAAGRVYLAKDSRLRPELVPVMYPRMDEMARVCRRVDPDGVLASDLSRRLGIPQ